MSNILSFAKRIGKRQRKDKSTSSESPAHSSSSSSHNAAQQSHIQEADDTPLVNQPSGRTLGIIFCNQDHVDRFFACSKRKMVNTKFYNKDDMLELGLHVGIVALFKNIGWDGFLDWVALGYEQPILEFTCSCRNTTDSLVFRMGNSTVSISSDQLCELAGAPVENTIGPNSPNQPKVDYASFWRDITGLDTYNPRHIKTSWIRHPVLRIAARLLALAFFCKEEAGTMNTNEFFVLWCMVYEPDVKPNFGDYLRHYLKKNADAHKTTIHYSGLITCIINSKFLRFNIPDHYKAFESEPYLSKAHLVASRVLRIDTNTNTFTWLLGIQKTPYLSLKRKDFKLLKLKKKISDTNWLLGEGASGSGSRQGEDEPETDTPPPHPARHSDASFFAPIQPQFESLNASYQGLYSSYQGLQSNFQGLQDHYASLSSDVSSLRSDYTSLNTAFNSFRYDFDEERRLNEAARNEMHTYIAGRQSVDNDMHRMIESIFNWNLGPSNPPPHE